jgi:hypothetical protein
MLADVQIRIRPTAQRLKPQPLRRILAELRVFFVLFSIVVFLAIDNLAILAYRLFRLLVVQIVQR